MKEHSSPPARHIITLPGCRPVPLAAYLKALGIFRIVAEQADSGARGYWHADQFVLESSHDEAGIVGFFLNDYVPTPIAAPWNGGSGFYPKDNQSGIAPIMAGEAQRFAIYREVIDLMKSILEDDAITERPDGEAKQQLLTMLRAQLPDAALPWLDAAILIGEDNPRYPPLLGTGGNDGRLDFTNNFMQRLVELLDPTSGRPRAGAAELLDEALFAARIPAMTDAAIGQFAPGNAGGTNQGSGFAGSAQINPWSFVLMLEGTLLFAAAATRRLEGGESAALSYPFTVRSTGAGSGATALGDEANARAEIWIPLWGNPVDVHELRAMLSEGRVTVGRTRARDGLDFVRAIARLGVQRGIDSFQRYAFLMRSGKAYLATPLNRFPVRANPAARLIDELEQSQWLGRFRRLSRQATAPARLTSLARALEEAVFNLAQDDQDTSLHVQRLLTLLGRVQRYLAASREGREKCPPVPVLSRRWLEAAEDGSSELSIATALAGLHGRRHVDGQDRWAMPMRQHMAPEAGGRYPKWSGADGHDVTWGGGDLHVNLMQILQRRLLAASRLELADKPLFGTRNAPLAAVADLLAGQADARRIAELLPGLALVRIPHGIGAMSDRVAPLPAAYRMLKPLFCTDRQLRNAKLLTPGAQLPLPSQIPRLLWNGRTREAVDQAARRLRIAGVSTIGSGALDAEVPDSRLLLSTLMIPISDRALESLLPKSRTEQDNPETQGVKT